MEDPETAERSEMPAATLGRAGADHVLPLEQIGPLLAHLDESGIA